MIRSIVIIGYGNIARKHAEVFQALGCRIKASSNRSASNQKLAQQDGIPKIYSDFHEMILTEKPDGILVCVSFWNMFSVLAEVIPYGIPVLAEKPTGTTLVEHLKLKDLAAQYHTSVMVGLNRRHYSVLNKAIEHCGGREEITNVLIEWSEDPDHLKNNRLLTDEQIAMQIFGNTVHGLDLLIYIAGEIKDPSISISDFGAFRRLMNLNGKSVTNTLFNFSCSWDNPVPWRVVFYAKNKRYVFSPLETCELTEGKQKSIIEPDETDKQYKAGFYKQAEIFISQKNDVLSYDLSSVNNSMELAQGFSDSF